MSDTDDLKSRGHPSVLAGTGSVDIHASHDLIQQGIQGARVGKVPRSPTSMLAGIQGPSGLNRTSD